MDKEDRFSGDDVREGLTAVCRLRYLNRSLKDKQKQSLEILRCVVS